jgi:uncharacterized protein DUF5134
VSALPGWLAVVLAAAMIGVAACCGGRLLLGLATGRPVERDIEISHLLMGIAMAGMLVGALATASPDLWAVTFGVVGLWFAGRLVLRRPGGLAGLGARTGHYGPHLLMAGTMVYMVLAMSTTAPVSVADLVCGSQMLGMTMPGPIGGSVPTAALVLGLFCLGDAALVARRWRGPTGLGASTAAVDWSEPRPALSLATVGGSASATVELPAIESPTDDAVVESERPGVGWLLGSRLGVACHVVMAATMGIALLTLR